jgi:hypothetical protein
MTPSAPVATLPHFSRNGKDCRVWVRHECNLPTICQPVAARGPDEPQWEARIRDISPGGVGLLAVRRFERGTGLAIEIPEAGDYAGDTLLARVVHINVLPEGGWLLGCAFVSPLSEDTVTRLAHLKQSHDDAEPEDTLLEEPEPDPAETQEYIPESMPLPAAAAAVVVPRVLWRNADTGTDRVARRLLLNGSWPLLPRTVLKLWVENKTGDGDYTKVVVNSCIQYGHDWVVSYSVLGRAAPRMAQWIEQG